MVKEDGTKMVEERDLNGDLALMMLMLALEQDFDVVCIGDDEECILFGMRRSHKR